MNIIGITGNSGSGKSTVSKMINENYNAKIIDADRIAKEMCKRVLESGDYYKALLIISEYVETELSPPPKENKKTKKKNQPER